MYFLLLLRIKIYNFCIFFPFQEKHIDVKEKTWKMKILVQSICTLYSCFEIMGGFVTLKKIKSKIWTWKKVVAKNKVIVIQIEKRPGCLFSFWITMTQSFCTLLFSGPYFGLVPDPKKISCRPDKLEKWVQIDLGTVHTLFAYLTWPTVR